MKVLITLRYYEVTSIDIEESQFFPISDNVYNAQRNANKSKNVRSNIT